ncbi:hypothetical protein PPGU19_052410 [Paraburkholderia sp. PGU19]|nr:hypothetical protein PPGU19_052410 [Paraburkholderia sp. PGU19]
MAIRVMAHALLAGGDTATGRGDMPDRPERTGKAAMIHVPGQPISIAGASRGFPGGQQSPPRLAG